METEEVYYHNLINLSESRAAISNALDDIDEDFVWLDEILTEYKNLFSKSKIILLPKTPSQKKAPRRKVRRRPCSDDAEDICESVSSVDSQPTGSTSDTPVRPKRATRSRNVQQAAPVRFTRSTRSASTNKSAEVHKGAESTASQDKPVKDALPSVSEFSEQMATSPAVSSALPTESTPNQDEGDKGKVRQKAQAYEHMLSEKKLLSPVAHHRTSREVAKSPAAGEAKTPQKEQVCVEVEVHDDVHPEPVDAEVAAPSRRPQRSSVASRRSSAAGKRTSLRVLGSKARMRSLHGRLSVTKQLASLPGDVSPDEQTAESVEKAAEAEQSECKQKEEKQDNLEMNEPRTKAPRTRLRLKKNTTSTTDPSSTSDETSESPMEEEGHLVASAGTDKSEKVSPAQSTTRTKRKKQKSLTSDEELVQAKQSRRRLTAEADDEASPRRQSAGKKAAEEKAASAASTDDDAIDPKGNKSSANSEGGTRARTRARKKAAAAKDTTSSEETEGSVFESPSSSLSRQSRLSSKMSAADVTVDSGRGVSCTTAILKSAGDEGKDPLLSKSSCTSVSAEVAPPKVDNAHRRGTHVISRAPDSADEEEVRPVRSTRTKTRQAQNKSRDSGSPLKAPEPADQPRMTRTKTRKRHAEEEAADLSQSKRSCVETPPKAEQPPDDEVMEADDDSDYEDIEPDPPGTVNRTVPSFLNQMRKSSLSHSTNLVSGVVTSFLKRNTPTRKPTFQAVQEQKKKELLQKERREQERLSKLDNIRRTKAEEQKRKREERMRKVAEMREMRQRKEDSLKKNLAEKLKERLNSTDRMKEDKFKEEREKQKLRLRRQLEADERRRQEEDQRMKKQLEQQEEQKRHKELLQRRREQEEQERQRRQAEELRKQEERQAELERQRKAEQERLLAQKLERERELQREREQRERQAAQEKAERDRQELERKREREIKIQRELEKLKELQQQRQQRMAAEEEEKRREEARIQQIIQQHNRNLPTVNTTLTLTSSFPTKPSAPQPNPADSHDSYPITPVRQRKKASLENYDISDLRSDDSTDEDEAPRKRIPSWAQGAALKAMLINQVYHPPDLDSIFPCVAPPDLNEMFERKRPRFNKRTSSAVWNSPLHKSHC